MKRATHKAGKKLFYSFISAFFLLSSVLISSSFAEIVRYDFDSSSSKLIFHGKSTLFHGFEGTVGEVSGFAEGNTENIGRNAKGVFQANVKSMKCENEKMTKNMLKDMEAEKYPTIDFELSDVTVLKSPDKKKDYYLTSVTGVLTIHGIEKKITFPAEVIINGKDFNLSANVKLSLKDFNIKPATLLFFIRVKDRIDLDINIRGTRN